MCRWQLFFFLLKVEAIIGIINTMKLVELVKIVGYVVACKTFALFAVVHYFSL